MEVYHHPIPFLILLPNASLLSDGRGVTYLSYSVERKRRGGWEEGRDGTGRDGDCGGDEEGIKVKTLEYDREMCGCA